MSPESKSIPVAVVEARFAELSDELAMIEVSIRDAQARRGSLRAQVDLLSGLLSRAISDGAAPGSDSEPGTITTTIALQDAIVSLIRERPGLLGSQIGDRLAPRVVISSAAKRPRKLVSDCLFAARDKNRVTRNEAGNYFVAEGVEQ